MRALALLAALVSVTLVPGCGGDGGGGEAGGDGTTTATGEGTGQRVEVSAKDFLFQPARLTVDAGEVTFVLTNDGNAPHALEIEGNGVEEETDTIDPGDSTELTVDLEDGTYEMYCPVDGHRERGMEGTLTVGAGGGGATTDDSEGAETETGETQTGTTTDETETGEDDSGGSGSGSGY